MSPNLLQTTIFFPPFMAKGFEITPMLLETVLRMSGVFKHEEIRALTTVNKRQQTPAKPHPSRILKQLRYAGASFPSPMMCIDEFKLVRGLLALPLWKVGKAKTQVHMLHW